MNDIAKASLLLSMYKVIQRKKDPVQQAHLYNMVFQYLYENIIPSEDDEFFDLFISWQPQMDYELNAKLSGKKGREVRAEKKSESENVQNSNKNEELQGQNGDTVSQEDSFFDVDNNPYKGIQQPYSSNVNVNVNVNDNDNAHENVNVGARECGNQENLDVSQENLGISEKKDSQQSELSTQNIGQLQKDIWFLIKKHNETAINPRKIVLSGSFIDFIQREAREILAVKQDIAPKEILNAMQNYISVADSPDTWKSSFSVHDFCKNYASYTPEYFSITRFLKDVRGPNVPETQTELTANTILKTLGGDSRFDYSFFLTHQDKWQEVGKPSGENYFKWQDLAKGA